MLFSCALLVLSSLSAISAQPTAASRTVAVRADEPARDFNPFHYNYTAADSLVARDEAPDAARSYREVVRSRQANMKGILERATRRTTAPRAYISGT